MIINIDTDDGHGHAYECADIRLPETGALILVDADGYVQRAFKNWIYFEVTLTPEEKE